MRRMGTNLSAFTARIGLGGGLFGLARLARQGRATAILICNQGVGGSSPSGGTTLFKHLAATTEHFAVVPVPILRTACRRFASVPRIAHPKPPLFSHRRRNGDCAQNETARAEARAVRLPYREGFASSAVIVSRGVLRAATKQQPSACRREGDCGRHRTNSDNARHFEDPTLDASTTASPQTRARIADRASPHNTPEPRWPRCAHEALTTTDSITANCGSNP